MNSRRFVSFFLTLGLIFGVLLFEFSFLPVLPSPFFLINAPLLAVICFTFLYDFHRGLFLALSLGALFDLLTANQFGITTLTLLLTFFCVHLLLQLVFTNKSCYSLMALGIIGALFYNLLSLLTQIIVSFLEIVPFKFRLSLNLVENFLWELFFTLLFLWIFWHIMNTLTKKFKMVFVKS